MWRDLKAFRHSRKIDSMFVRENRGNLFYDSNTFDWYCSSFEFIPIWRLIHFNFHIYIVYKLCIKIRQWDWNISRSTDKDYPGSMISTWIQQSSSQYSAKAGIKPEREYRLCPTNTRTNYLMRDKYQINVPLSNVAASFVFFSLPLGLPWGCFDLKHLKIFISNKGNLFGSNSHTPKEIIHHRIPKVLSESSE